METTKSLSKSIFRTKKTIRRAKKIYFIINEASNATLLFFGVYFVNNIINCAEKCSTTKVIMAVAVIAIIESMYVMSRIEYKMMDDICKDMENLLNKQKDNNIEIE